MVLKSLRGKIGEHLADLRVAGLVLHGLVELRGAQFGREGDPQHLAVVGQVAGVAQRVAAGQGGGGHTGAGVFVDVVAQENDGVGLLGARLILEEKCAGSTKLGR